MQIENLRYRIAQVKKKKKKKKQPAYSYRIDFLSRDNDRRVPSACSTAEYQI